MKEAPESQNPVIAEIEARLKTINTRIEKALDEIKSLTAIWIASNRAASITEKLVHAKFKAGHLFLEKAGIAAESYIWYKNNAKKSQAFLYGALLYRSLQNQANAYFTVAKYIDGKVPECEAREIQELDMMQIELAERFKALISGEDIKHPHLTFDDIYDLQKERDNLALQLLNEREYIDQKMHQQIADHLEKLISWYQQYNPKDQMILFYEIHSQLHAIIAQLYNPSPTPISETENPEKRFKFLQEIAQFFYEITYPEKRENNVLH